MPNHSAIQPTNVPTGATTESAVQAPGPSEVLRQQVGQLGAELLVKHQEKLVSRFGQAVVSAAQSWGTTDYHSVAAIHNALDGETLPPSATQVYLSRAIDPTLTPELMAYCVVHNNPHAVATVMDYHQPKRQLLLNSQVDIFSKMPEQAAADMVNETLWKGAISIEAANRALEPHACNIRDLLQDRTLQFTLRPVRKMTRDLPRGGLNCLVTLSKDDANPYKNDVNSVVVKTNLREVLEQGGVVHRDIEAARTDAVVIEMPPGVGLPVYIA